MAEFQVLQLQHTHDQLLAGLQDLLGSAESTL